MKKIVKNCLIGASLVVMLAFTFFLSINAKNSIKASGYTYEEKLVNDEQILSNVDYYIDVKPVIEYYENGNSITASTYVFYPTIENVHRPLINYELVENTSVEACIYKNENELCGRDLNNYTLPENSIYLTISIDYVPVSLYINDLVVPTYRMERGLYIIDNNIYYAYGRTIIFNENGTEPLVVGSIENTKLYFKYESQNVMKYRYIPDVSVYWLDNLYKKIVPPPTQMQSTIENIVNGLGSIFNDFIPSFVGAVVLTAQTAFITSNGTGTIVLGALVAACGIALTISILRFVLNLIRLKRKV